MIMPVRSRLLMLALAVVGLALVAGCSSSTPSQQYDPTTQALNDPMNYSPDKDEDISGGGLTEFHGDAFKKDMDHVLNP
jgi:hypothetical protein